jgi:peptidoglycan LD-endopeptidase CwlK
MRKNYIKFLVLFLIPVGFLTLQNNIKNTPYYSIITEKKSLTDTNNIIIDSNSSLNDALTGIDIPPGIKKLLTIINVYYYSFDGKLHKGQIVINKVLAKDIKDIFGRIAEKKFLVKKVIPINKYNWSDEASAEDNNTSAFNYRKVKGTKILSYHAAGRAIDINPMLNPQINNRRVFPKGSSYNIKVPGTISGSSFIVKSFLKKGWRWGGNWKHLKDYQHFEK